MAAKLVDVYPPSPDDAQGFAMNLTDSILQLRYRNGGTPEPLTPGTVYECTFTLYPTANLFRTGHRVRLDVSSSNDPRFDLNPNTGDPLRANRLTRIATNTIHPDRNSPSRLTLPLVEGLTPARG